jgi:thiosulfate dehydrogenase [quinone] large subunit
MVYSKPQLFFLVLLRLFVGWHFLYEGLVKLLNPGWTAKGYLQSAEGALAPLFQWLGSDTLLPFANTLTIIALLVTGLTLILGFGERWGAWVGMGMLAFFYLSHPALPSLANAGPSEGNYFLVDKNLVEFAALGVLFCFPTSHILGIATFWRKPALHQPTQ